MSDLIKMFIKYTLYSPRWITVLIVWNNLNKEWIIIIFGINSEEVFGYRHDCPCHAMLSWYRQDANWRWNDFISKGSDRSSCTYRRHNDLLTDWPRLSLSPSNKEVKSLPFLCPAWDIISERKYVIKWTRRQIMVWSRLN